MSHVATEIYTEKSKSELGVNSNYAWLVWAISTSYVLFQFVMQFSAGLMIQQWEHDFGLNATHAGFLTASYYYIYVSLQIPAGFLVDRFGTRLLLTSGACVCAFGCGLLMTAQSFIAAEIGRVLMGGGLAFGFVSMVYLTGRWFSLRRFAFMISLTEMCALLGTLLSDTFLAPVVTAHGWRLIVKISMFGALMLATLVVSFVRDAPNKRKKYRQLDQPEEPVLAVTVLLGQAKALLSNPQIWRLGLYAGAMFAVVTVFAGVWAEPFFMTAYHLRAQEAVALSSILMLGIVVGCPVVGWLGAKIRSTKPYLMVAALLSSLLILLLLLNTHLPYGIIACCMFLIGFTNSWYVLTFGLANRLSPGTSRGTCIGFMNTLAVLTAPLMQPLVGWLLDLAYQGDLSQHVHQYTVQAYQVALVVVPAALVIAAGLILIGPTISPEK